MAGGGRGLSKFPLPLLFLLILALSSGSSSWCSSAYGVSDDDEINYFTKITVWVYNDLDQNTPLTMHCKSKDDDLGEHTMTYTREWHWSFRNNFFWTTRFWCNMWWHDSNGRLVQASHDAYYARRDFSHHCRSNCFWSIRKEGWYYGETQTGQQLMFTWTNSE